MKKTKKKTDVVRKSTKIVRGLIIFFAFILFLNTTVLVRAVRSDILRRDRIYYLTDYDSDFDKGRYLDMYEKSLMSELSTNPSSNDTSEYEHFARFFYNYTAYVANKGTKQAEAFLEEALKEKDQISWKFLQKKAEEIMKQ